MKNRQIFYGWYIVAACALVAGAGIGFHNTAGIFLRPVTDDLGFSRGEFTFFRTISAILSVLLLPVYGKTASVKVFLYDWFATYGADGLGVRGLGCGRRGDAMWYYTP